MARRFSNSFRQGPVAVETVSGGVDDVKAPLILFLLGRVLRQRQPFDYGLIFVLLSASPVNRFKLASSSITTN
jgi:hypothetical protein